MLFCYNTDHLGATSILLHNNVVQKYCPSRGRFSPVSVVIVIIAICDMPREEFSLCVRMYVYSQYVYEKQKVVFWNTNANFEQSFQNDLCLIPVQLGGQAKTFRETGSVKNREVNRRRHVLTEETLHEIGERNWTEITVSVWEQRQYADLLVGKPASQGREQQPSVAARIIWEDLYYNFVVHRCGPGGIMLTCHAAGPGSIPGRDKFPGWVFSGVFLTCQTNVGKL